MNIVDAIRKMCEEKNGFRNLFNKALSYEKLCSLVDDKKDAELFATLIYGKARRILLMLIQDTYNYKKHAIQVEAFLQADGLSASDARKALEVFYRAFGFPDYREMDKRKMAILVDGDDHFRTTYTGEVRDGKEYGIGTRTCYYEGKFSSCDESVWINGEMTGYISTKEIEFFAFETFKIGFVVEDYLVGNTMFISGEDKEYQQGVKLGIE